VQDAFGIVIFAVVIVAAVVALLTLGLARGAYDQIGRGGMSLRDGSDRGPEPARGGAASAQERDAEIRQMLAARNERRLRRGEDPLDVDAELARLTASSSAADPALAAEVRSLVIARNERRERRGQPPLDVEAEVARQLADLR
jgi:hypothetical protein